MSCQSYAARAFLEDKDTMTHCDGNQRRTCSIANRSVRFSSESRSSTREKSNDAECKRETPGSISLTTLSVTPGSGGSYAMSQSAPPPSATFDLNEAPSPQVSSCRFPKLEECAHFHYDRVSLGGLSIETIPCDQMGTDCSENEGWICLKVRSHVNSACEESVEARTLSSSWTEASDVREWTLTRNMDNFLQLDDMLHRCIYDRKVSGLPNLTEELSTASVDDEMKYRALIADYVHHLSIIADDSINCGPVLNWLQMDNKGHKLLVANEDSSSINTPAVAAAYSVRKYVSQARDEISFEVGDMISIIDMPLPQESLWWRGKRGFRVGFFPHHCVAVIGDKVPRNMTQPPPIVGSVAVAPIKPVLRKHGKLISLFRSFILSRPSRRSLKQQGILKERVFGCDLGEHLLNCGHEVPLVLVECAGAIEERGAVDGVYRLSGGSGLTQRLRADFDSGSAPDLSAPAVVRDPHAVASLLKMYFRELPNPLCTYQLYESFVSAVQQPDEASKLRAVRDTVVKLPPPHYRTLAYLMRHLRRVSLLGKTTGMTARNMAIVWAPNLLRSPRPQHALQGVAVQAVVTEFLICFAEDLFAQEQGEAADSGPDSLEQEQDRCDVQIEYRGNESCRRPKSLPLNPPTKLLSLEEARRRGKCPAPGVQSPRLPPPSGDIAAAAYVELRPQTNTKPKYIEVGSGPNNLPRYHTVLELPLPGSKRGLKRSPSGWRGLFSRSKQQRPRAVRVLPSAPVTPPVLPVTEDIPMPSLRPVKSCESLASDTDTLAPLAERAIVPLKQHTRSSSCDSYFEPWQAELADMRLRLSPQERDHHMFSEEDDTIVHNAHIQGDSLCSTPPESGLCSAEPSPRRNLRVDIETANELAERKRTALEDQIAEISYIDGDSPRCKPAEKRQCTGRPHSPHQPDIAKRLCKDRESPKASLSDFQTSINNVKLRERSSPRKTKSSARYSGMHQPINLTNNQSYTSNNQSNESNSQSNESNNQSNESNNQSNVSNNQSMPSNTNRYFDASILENLPESPSSLTYAETNFYESPKSLNYNVNNSTDSPNKLSHVKSNNVSATTNRLSDSNTLSSLTNNLTKRQSDSVTVNRLSWHGRDGHSTLIKVDWPVENSSVSNLTTSTLNSTPITPITPIYDPLESDSELSDANKHTIKIEGGCENCHEEKCLKCELKATDYENVKFKNSPVKSDSPDKLGSPKRYGQSPELSETPDQLIELESPQHILSSPMKYKDSLERYRGSSEKIKTTPENRSPEKIRESPDGFRSSPDKYRISPDKCRNSPEKFRSSPDNRESPDKFPDHSPATDVSYQNLNRLSATSSDSDKKHYENSDVMKVMTSSHESSSSYSNNSLKHDYEGFCCSRPNYINLQSSSTSKSSPGSPLKSPLKSTISITFRSPTKVKSPDYELIDNIDTPTNDRDSIYEDIDLEKNLSIVEKNLSIVEDATVPQTDASLPTQQACQPHVDDLIILDSPEENVDVYSQVKFFKKSIDEVNAMVFEPENERQVYDKERHYENVNFDRQFENVKIDALKIGDVSLTVDTDLTVDNDSIEKENGNIVKPMNVRELANRFESPTEPKSPFVFEKFKAEIKYPSLERKVDDKISLEIRENPIEPIKELKTKKSHKLSKNSNNTRSLDENAFVKEFGNERTYVDRRKSLEVRDSKAKGKFLPDLNLNMEEHKIDEKIGSITPTTENKICLIQRFDVKKPTEIKNLIGFDTEKKLSRERIEKYKEERRLFLREKYSSQSFRSNPEQLTRIKIKKDFDDKVESNDRLKEDPPKFERRNTVDLGQRMRFSLAKSANNLDTIPSPSSPESDYARNNIDFPKREDYASQDADLLRRELDVSRKDIDLSIKKLDLTKSDSEFLEKDYDCISRGSDSSRKSSDCSRNGEESRRDSACRSRDYDRKEKMSPSFNIRDMAAMFEQKSQNNSNLG